MLFHLRRKRKKMFNKKIFTYLSYAIGEILLVVVGILVAIKIDDWNRDRERYRDELESYELIIVDLKRESTLFSQYLKVYNSYLDSYFQMNEAAKSNNFLQKIFPDFLVSNIQFNPVTKNNHAASIEKLRDANIRERINNYFVSINRVHQAKEEFNDFIVRESRPFFLKEQEIFNNEVVFNNEDKGFPPLKRISTIDTTKLKEVMDHPYFIPILSQLRMSIGFYLVSLEKSAKENYELIRDLQENIK